jgi:hypothetical protein
VLGKPPLLPAAYDCIGARVVPASSNDAITAAITTTDFLYFIILQSRSFF